MDREPENRQNEWETKGDDTMQQPLMTLIRDRMSRFSKGQKRIASYILEHYEEAAFLTACRLGKTVGVSESTVVRFAAELGFEGYPELQQAMQEMIRSRLTSVQRVEVTRSRMADNEVLDHVMSCDIHNVRRTLDELPRDTFYAAVEALVSAKRVYVFGAGSCRALANFAAYYLKLLLPDLHLIYTNSGMEILEEMMTIGPEDTLLGLSFPRYSSKTVSALHFAHDRGAKVIAITDSRLSPIAPYATYLLLAHSDLATIVDSLVAPLSILNSLIVAVSLRRQEANQAALSDLERMWAAYGVYQPFETAVEEAAMGRPEETERGSV